MEINALKTMITDAVEQFKTAIATFTTTTSIKVHTGFAVDFLWLGLDFFPVRGTTIYVRVYGYIRRVHVRIKGMARNKPLLVR